MSLALLISTLLHACLLLQDIPGKVRGRSQPSVLTVGFVQTAANRPATATRKAEPAATKPSPLRQANQPPAQEIASESGKIGNEGEPERYFPNALLDRPSVPVSGPDPYRFLEGTALPELPIRLRLFIDTNGEVRNVTILPPELVPPEQLPPVLEMFRETRFVPGSIRGTKIPSYLDIEIELKDYRP